MGWAILIIIILGVLGYFGRKRIGHLLGTTSQPKDISEETLERLKKKVAAEEEVAKEWESKAKLAKEIKQQRDKITAARNRTRKAQEEIRQYR